LNTQYSWRAPYGIAVVLATVRFEVSTDCWISLRRFPHFTADPHEASRELCAKSARRQAALTGRVRIAQSWRQPHPRRLSSATAGTTVAHQFARASLDGVAHPGYFRPETQSGVALRRARSPTTNGSTCRATRSFSCEIWSASRAWRALLTGATSVRRDPKVRAVSDFLKSAGRALG
jgi:hypothetical protein